MYVRVGVYACTKCLSIHSTDEWCFGLDGNRDTFPSLCFFMLKIFFIFFQRANVSIKETFILIFFFFLVWKVPYPLVGFSVLRCLFNNALSLCFNFLGNYISQATSERAALWSELDQLKRYKPSLLLFRQLEVWESGRQQIFTEYM